MLFAPCTKQVISIEINPEAVDNAKTLMSLNGIKNVKAMCGDFNKILPTLTVPENTVFFVDPPRAGLGDSVVRRICTFAPKTVIYMSCNPDTLKSDLFTFTANGYTITEVTPFDMFPNTKHVESIVCLTRR
jgi:tRNA/tmRNA/rRNA uracil-C5-methylase (TrmA/RlmC/RlmD family)